MYTGGSRRELWFVISDLFLQQFPYCIQLGNPISNRREHLYTKPPVFGLMDGAGLGEFLSGVFLVGWSFWRFIIFF